MTTGWFSLVALHRMCKGMRTMSAVVGIDLRKCSWGPNRSRDVRDPQHPTEHTTSRMFFVLLTCDLFSAYLLRRVILIFPSQSPGVAQMTGRHEANFHQARWFIRSTIRISGAIRKVGQSAQPQLYGIFARILFLVDGFLIFRASPGEVLFLVCM